MKGPTLVAGQRFGRLVVLEEAPRRPARPSQTGATAVRQLYHRYWSCRCDCGAATVVLQWSLTSGCSRSCGCLRAEVAAAASRARAAQRRAG